MKERVVTQAQLKNITGRSVTRQQSTRKLTEELRTEKQKTAALADEIQIYSEILEEAESELRSAKAERDALQQKLRAIEMGMKNKNRAEAGGLLAEGTEHDLYDGEQREILVDALKRSLDGLPDRCRRRDVITSIISANPVKEVPKTSAFWLKKAFKGYKHFDAKLRSGLNEMGIQEKDSNGSHIQLRYYNDDRYTVTVSLTPSDARAGDRIAGDLIRTMM